MPTEILVPAEDDAVERLRIQANQLASEGSESTAPVAELAVDTHNSQETPLEDAPRTTTANEPTNVIEVSFESNEDAKVEQLMQDPAGLSEHIAAWMEYFHVA